MKTSKDQTKMIPPDGGWGWIVVFGSCLIYISTISVGPSFGLLFGDLLKQLGVQTTGASFVISTLDTIYNFTGLTIGPLVKKFTCRRIAILGSLFSTAAFLLTVPANSMLHILITFGLLGGIGFSLAAATSMIVINDYFSKKKGQAIGLAMTGTAVGFMLIPQLVSFLLDEYDFRSALLIMGAVSLHAVVGASLFQPVSWHKKSVKKEADKEEADILLLPNKIEKKDSSPLTGITNELRCDMISPDLDGRENSLNIPSESFSRKQSLHSNISSLDDAEKTINIKEITEIEFDKELEKISMHSQIREIDIENNPTNDPPKKIKKSITCISRLFKLLDLDLLRDGVYWNINYGLSILFVVETNFRLILPFFLSNLGFKNSEIASALSSMAVADISVRVIVPPILDRLTITRRATFMFSSICVAVCRSCLASQKTIGPIITFLVMIGFFRGISLTSIPLVLTEYSSGDNFPSVLGLSKVCRGVLIAVLVPLAGYIRDLTNSYRVYIHCQTVLMISVLITWIAEIIILKKKKKNQAIIHVIKKEARNSTSAT